MTTRIANIICLIIIAAFGAYVVWIYPGLPDPMPTHWNAAGEIDDYSSKPFGATIIGLVPVFSFAIFKLIPVISPRGFRTESFTGVLNILMTATVLFGAIIGVGVFRAANDPSVNISTFVFVAVGLLFIVIGNFLGKVRKNFFLGIRTPWTLASDEVWAKTHRLGGWCFVVAGVIMALMGAAAPASNMGWVIGVVVAIALIPVVYSFFAYRKIEGFAPDPDIDED
ncbi:MAG: SdpI family protein [Woeseiaceae bacterium]